MKLGSRIGAITVDSPGRYMRFFGDRSDAGAYLAQYLATHPVRDPRVLGLARGGVLVAAEVARKLGGELDMIIARKLGANFDPVDDEDVRRLLEKRRRDRSLGFQEPTQPFAGYRGGDLVPAGKFKVFDGITSRAEERDDRAARNAIRAEPVPRTPTRAVQRQDKRGRTFWPVRLRNVEDAVATCRNREFMLPRCDSVSWCDDARSQTGAFVGEIRARGPR